MAWDYAEALALLLADGTNSYIYGPGGLPIEQMNNSTNTPAYLHHDQQGSTRLITGSAGKVEGKCSYGIYGAPMCEGTITTPLGYDAQYTSADTGLVYMRSRVYDPASAQFLTVDPIEAQTREPYSYAADEPAQYTDPSGRAIEIELPEAPSYLPHLSPEGKRGVEELWTQVSKKVDRTTEELNGEEAGEEGNGAQEVKEREEEKCGPTVEEILKGKQGSIKRAPLPPGSPSWSDISRKTLGEIREAARRGEPGYKAIYKLLTSGRFNKPK